MSHSTDGGDLEIDSELQFTTYSALKLQPSENVHSRTHMFHCRWSPQQRGPVLSGQRCRRQAEASLIGENRFVLGAQCMPTTHAEVKRSHGSALYQHELPPSLGLTARCDTTSETGHRLQSTVSGQDDNSVCSYPTFHLKGMWCLCDRI